jgi:hypothetical protein
MPQPADTNYMGASDACVLYQGQGQGTRRGKTDREARKPRPRRMHSPGIHPEGRDAPRCPLVRNGHAKPDFRGFR